MDMGTAVAIIGTVFSISSSISYAIAKTRGAGTDVGQKLDDISATLGGISLKVESFALEHAKTSIRLKHIEENTGEELKKLELQLQELYSWRLKFVQGGNV